MKKYTLLKKIATAIIIGLVSFSCEPEVTRNGEQAKATDQKKSESNIIYGNLIIKEQSDYLMIPVNFTDQDRNQDNNLSVSRSYGKSSSLYNIVFYRKQDGEAHLLLNKKALINSFDFLEVKTTNQAVTRIWLYKIIDQDTNGDKKINIDDAIVGYISDLSGKNIQQITPNNTQVLNWVVVPSQNAIFIKILKDSNNDKKFSAEDNTNFVRVNLDRPGIGTEIISDRLEQEVKSYIVK
ncbi:hypothetical protein VF14_28470 [Nostoc linckia z18]|uniref:Uncharacterized protein n=2 Tax=Nostoc linckia TaxID=92942 RepID=A0A9Q5ZBF5_NOSLI|nr:hypothetical protein [Nostoc linckia]PHK38537.1 hypothetical protein VF12_17790 [Nostoc linckia z15]PHK43360.1 hypothetical protein VF13_27625 [Nostoc linckia z16]PHJ57975.1 hypothetical protein VF05_34845 [Nostoc linckia z3]PHJ58406.1 hypothetical protein VF02_27880 [Nostoc linckia z1]PHJ65904.1 hypothetical protein VF03_27260 [Nostoc linckia z2]